jgi:hypothetical protein
MAGSRRYLAVIFVALGIQSAAAGAPETVVVQGVRQPSSPEACLKIAEAKVREWAQARLLRDRTDTMSDGTKRDSEMIFTENGLFLRAKNIWRTSQVLRNQRAADSAPDVAKRMGLSDCSAGDDVQDSGQPATIYTYRQAPEIVTEMWIGDATGLPLRMEITRPAGEPGEPVEISMRYAYGDAVHVPNGTQLADFQRMMISQDWLRDLQMHRPTH